MDSFEQKRILVTGGCGSIGQQIVDTILQYNPDLIRVADNNETNLSAMQNEHKESDNNTEYTLLNIRDRTQITRVIDGIDIVIHAAALKHVPLVEQNPYEAIKTNIVGTKNLIDISLKNDVERFIGISTDKAASPSSTMGATKLIAERLISANASPNTGIDFGSVRFGNVLGTRGSVVPIFYNQIKNGGPITVTDRRMTRFVMTPQNAADFAISSCSEVENGEVFVKKMSSIDLGTLADTMREYYSPQFGLEPKMVEIETIGPRKGEKYHEKLISAEEMRYVHEREDLFILDMSHSKVADENSLDDFSSFSADRLDKNELIDMLEESYSR